MHTNYSLNLETEEVVTILVDEEVVPVIEAFPFQWKQSEDKQLYTLVVTKGKQAKVYLYQLIMQSDHHTHFSFINGDFYDFRKSNLQTILKKR